jgi:nucleoside-diphosphate-sugar epimerase
VIVLVTGATGYIGSAVVTAMLERTQHSVIALGRSSEGLRRLEARHHRSQRVEIAEWSSFLARPRRADVVLHAAARISQEGADAGAALVAANVGVTLRLLHLCAAMATRRFIYLSSQVVYGSSGAPWSEADPPAPEGPYALTKYCGEEAVRSFRGKMEIAIVRLASVYGVTDALKPAELPARLADTICAGREFVIGGSGEQRSDLVHISDVTAGLVAALALDAPLQHDIYNIGGGGSTSINEIFRLMRDLARQKGLSVVEPRHDPARAPACDHRELVIDRARRDLSWEPKVSLPIGIAEYLDWASSRRSHSARATI